MAFSVTRSKPVGPAVGKSEGREPGQAHLGYGRPEVVGWMGPAGRSIPLLTIQSHFGILSGLLPQGTGPQMVPAAQAKSFVLRRLPLTQAPRIDNIEGYGQKWFAGLAPGSLTSDVS